MPTPPTPRLPIDEVLPELLERLRASPSVLLRAPTGAGKTTRVPPALLDGGIAGDGQVVVLEPRRLAARAAARRIARERGGKIGQEIGYQVRFDDRTGPRTRIRLVTEGIFLRLLQSDPFLTGIGAVVFDEFHERNLPSDLALALVRRVQREARDDLKLVVMSATLDIEPLRRYLDEAPVVESAGREFPVEMLYLGPDERPPRGVPDETTVARSARRLLPRTTGDLLVFLPGVGEIRRTARAIEGWARAEGLRLMELFGELSPERQDEVLEPGGPRKIVLATNVAETSVTLPGVGAVIDSGLVRKRFYDAGLGLDSLRLLPVSRASAEQRAGRAGRTGPGVCLRLWTEAEDRARASVEKPEVERVDLAPAVLELCAFGERRPSAFEWFEAPPEAALERAVELLKVLGALEKRSGGECTLTDLGREIVALPLPPRLARLFLAGVRAGAPEAAAACAALLAERSPFRRERLERPHASAVDSDLLDELWSLDEFERRGTTRGPAGTLLPGPARAVLRARDQLLRLAPSGPGHSPAGDPEQAISRALLAAFPDRVARRRERGGEHAVMVGGRGVRLARECGVRQAELFVCLEVDAGGRDSLVRRASAIELDWLDPARITTRTRVSFDRGSERVTALGQTLFEDLVLDESPTRLERDEASAAVLARAAAEDLARALELTDPALISFRARVDCLREWMSELELPPVSDDRLRELLPGLSAGRLSFAELRKAPLLDALRASFGWKLLQELDHHAPERLRVPSGSHLALVYEAGRPPVLPVRIQEVFGWTDTPRVASGRVPVLLHLLAPNLRPQQVTGDLRSFWANTYAQVRKDLRRRYPKHAWPEDPWSAEPIPGVRRRRK